MSNVKSVPAAAPAVKPADSSNEAVVNEQVANAASTARAARRRRVEKQLIGLAIWVALPTLIAALYYGLLAPDEFESNVVLMVQGNEGDAARRALLLSEHLSSRDALMALDRDTHFARHFQDVEDATSERAFADFVSHTSVRHDAHSSIVRIKARAYDGPSARRYAQGLVDTGEKFLNRVDARDRAPFIVVASASQPTEATYPRRGYNVLTAFLAALALYGVGSLLLAAMREHAHF